MITLDSNSTAFVIVDMENEFCKPGGKLYHSEGVDEVIPRLQHLLGRAREAEAQIIFVQSVRYPGSPEFIRFGQPPILLKRTWASQLIEELHSKAGEPVIEKNTHDCFYKTEMDPLLERLKIRPETHTIVVGGINANICVYHAVTGFHIRNYRVIVPLDCCAGSPAGREMLKAQMSDPAYSYNVTLTQSDELTFA